MSDKKSDPRALIRERLDKEKRIRELKLRVIKKVFSKIDFKMLHPERENSPANKKRKEYLEKIITNVILGLGMPLDSGKRLTKEILEYLMTFGILSDYILNPSISKIMVNQRDSIFIEEKEKMFMVKREFPTNALLYRIVSRIVKYGGGRINADNPVADIAIDDHIWVTAVVPPMSASGAAVLTIQKSIGSEFSIDELVENQTMSKAIAQFLNACVLGKRNIIISGISGSGRTTLLNTLGNLIPIQERVIIVEDRGEITLMHPNSCVLRPHYGIIQENMMNITPQLMLQTALKMRPDRIILGDCRGVETFELLQAMSSGKKGCLTTLHASSPADLISRIETLVLMSQESLSPKAVKNLILKSVDVIIHLEKMGDGSRKITHITELTGMEGDILTRTDIFKFRNLGISEEGLIDGIFEPTGFIPRFMPELKQMGIELPREIF